MDVQETTWLPGPISSCTLNEACLVIPTFKVGISDIPSFLMFQKVPQNQYFDRTVRVLGASWDIKNTDEREQENGEEGEVDRRSNESGNNDNE